MKLYNHQRKALAAAVTALLLPGSRATLTMACGTGKTLVSIKALEELTSDIADAKMIVFVPSLPLTDQLMTNFVRHNAFNGKFTVLPVASVGSSLYGEVDAIDHLEGVDPTVLAQHNNHPTILANTTDSKEIANALRNKGRMIVFCTYQSAGAVQKAVKSIKETSPGFAFDMAVMDEAHRTAGGGKDQSSSYLKCLNDTLIPIKRRLFVTATPRVRTVSNSFEAVNGRDSSKAREDHFYNYGFSMDDEDTYGKVVYKYPFSEAIADGMLADYRVYAVMISNKDLRTAAAMDSNVDLTDADLSDPASETLASAKNLALTAAITRLFGQGKVTAGLSFHQGIASSLLYSDDASGFLRHSDNQQLSTAFTAHVEGTTPQRERVAIMNKFVAAQREGRFAMLSNCNVYTEGVDVPEMDMVIFAENKTSKVSIVQAVGRAVRLNPNNPNKVASIIVPVFVGDAEDPEEAIANSKFDTLYSVIAALRESDNMEALYTKAIMREALTAEGISGDPGSLLIETVDSEGTNVAPSATSGTAPIVVVAPESSGVAADMDYALTQSYWNFAANCEAKMINSINSIFERNLGKLKAYKALHGKCAVIGKDEKVGNFAIGKAMLKITKDFNAGNLPETERAAYEAEGFLLTPRNEIVNKLRLLAASIS